MINNLFTRDMLMRAFPENPRLWHAFEAQAEAVNDGVQRLPDLETRVAVVDANATAAVAAASGAQAASPVLTGIAAVPSQAGAIEQTSPGVFAVRGIDQQDTTSLLSRQIGDTRYQMKFEAAPATSTSTGTAGRMAYDASYLYVCVATNSWKRVALTTF